MTRTILAATETTKSFSVTGFPAILIILAILTLIVVGAVTIVKKIKNRS